MLARYRRWRASSPQRKRIRAIRKRRSRCFECGLLGSYPTPDRADGPAADLSELTADIRLPIGGELSSARRTGALTNEFDPRRRPSLGAVTWLRLGVQCAIAHPNAASTSWMIPGRDQAPRDLFKYADGGALVSIPDPAYPGPLGRPVGVARTDLSALVLPHDCPYMVAHVPGLSPTEHIGLKDRRLRDRRDTLRKWLVAVATAIAALGGLILLLFRDASP